MRRRVGAVIEAEFAVVAFIDDLDDGRRASAWRHGPHTCRSVQQGVERRTEVETPPASVADFINAQRFFFQLRRLDRIENEAETFHFTQTLP